MELIEIKDYVKYLGIYIDTKLLYIEHIKKIRENNGYDV